MISCSLLLMANSIRINYALTQWCSISIMMLPYTIAPSTGSKRQGSSLGLLAQPLFLHCASQIVLSLVSDWMWADRWRSRSISVCGVWMKRVEVWCGFSAAVHHSISFLIVKHKAGAFIRAGHGRWAFTCFIVRWLNLLFDSLEGN